MTVAELEHFRDVLLQREDNLEEWLDEFGAQRNTDAQRVRELLDEIRAALDRVNQGTFGECIRCDGGMELLRLEVQPIRQVCLDCISAEERTELEEELSLAGKIHRALLPREIESIPGFDIAVRSQAARTVGGDYYDFLPAHGNGWNRVIIGDIMGKGIPAGLMLSNMQAALHILAEQIESPAQLITRLNRWMCHNIPVTKFVSFVCVGLGPSDNGHVPICYANAGHCPPILMHAHGDVEMLRATGTVVGVHEDFTFEEGRSVLNPGDWLLLYTDGVTEAANEKGDLYDDSRLVEVVHAYRHLEPNDLLIKIAESVQAFSNRTDYADDLTMIALRRTP